MSHTNNLIIFDSFYQEGLSAKLSRGNCEFIFDEPSKNCIGKYYSIEIFFNGELIKVDREFLLHCDSVLFYAKNNRYVYSVESSIKQIYSEYHSERTLEHGYKFDIRTPSIRMLDLLDNKGIFDGDDEEVFIANLLSYGTSKHHENDREGRYRVKSKIFFEGNQGNVKKSEQIVEKFHVPNFDSKEFVQRPYSEAFAISKHNRSVNIYRHKCRKLLSSKNSIIFVGGTGRYNYLGENLVSDIGYNLLINKLKNNFNVYGYDKFPVYYGDWDTRFENLVGDFDAVLERILALSDSVRVYSHSFGCVLAAASNNIKFVDGFYMHAPPYENLKKTMIKQNSEMELIEACKKFQNRRHEKLMRALGKKKPSFAEKSLFPTDSFNFFSSAFEIDPQVIITEAENKQKYLITGLQDIQVNSTKTIETYENHVQKTFTYDDGHFPSTQTGIDEMGSFILNPKEY